jgi:hypothetical protein
MFLPVVAPKPKRVSVVAPSKSVDSDRTAVQFSFSVPGAGELLEPGALFS